MEIWIDSDSLIIVKSMYNCSLINFILFKMEKIRYNLLIVLALENKGLIVVNSYICL